MDIRLIIVFTVFFAFGCKETVTVVEEVLPEYEELGRSRDPHKAVYQIVNYNNNLLLQSNNSHHIYFEDETNTTMITNHGARYREILNDEFVVSLRWNRLEVENIDPNERFANNSLSIVLDSILPQDYVVNHLGISILNSIGCLNNDNVLLLPYYTNINAQLNFLLIELESMNDLFSSIDYNVIGTFSYPNSVQYPVRGFKMIDIEGGFLMIIDDLTNNAVIKIENDGTNYIVQNHETSPGNTGFFKFEDVLYNWSRNFPDYDIIIYSSTDNGTTWTSSYRIETFTEYRFISTGDELFSLNMSNGQLLVMTNMSSENISFEALDNEQFWNYQIITDVAKYNEDVYISTLSGFYKRNWQEFIQSRIN